MADPTNPAQQGQPLPGQESRQQIFGQESADILANRPQAPIIGQDQLDAIEAFRSAGEALLQLSTRIQPQWSGISQAIGKSADHLERVERTQQKINRSTRSTSMQREQEVEFASKLQDAQERIAIAQEKGSKSLREQLRNANMIQQGQVVGEEGKRYSVADIDRWAKGGQIPDEVQHRLQRRMALGITNEGSTFSVRQMVQQLAHGNIGGAVGEAFQQLPFAQRLSEAGVARGGLGGLALRSAGGLLSPAAILGVEEAWRRGTGFYQTGMEQGMQTGRTGFGAFTESLAARFQGGRQALNPFDALTFAASRAIAKGVMSEGFSGQMRQAWQETVGNLVKETGMDAQSALTAMGTAVNTLGQNVNQFRASMEDVQGVAKDTNLSVSQVVKTFQDLETAGMAIGGVQGGQTYGQFAEILSRALPSRAIKSGAAQRIAQGVSSGATFLLGIAPMQAGNLTATQLAQYEDAMSQRLWDLHDSSPMFRSLSPHDFAVQGIGAGIINALPGFEQLTVQDVEDIMTTGAKHGGRGFTAQARALQEQKRLIARRGNLPRIPGRQGGLISDIRHHALLAGSLLLGGPLSSALYPVVRGLEHLPGGQSIANFLGSVAGDAASGAEHTAGSILHGIEGGIFGRKPSESDAQKAQERLVINQTMGILRQAGGMSAQQRQRIREQLTEEIGHRDQLAKSIRGISTPVTGGAALTHPGSAAEPVHVKIGFTEPAGRWLRQIDDPAGRAKYRDYTAGNSGSQGGRP